MNLLTAAALEAAEKPLTDNNVRPGLLGLFFFVALFGLVGQSGLPDGSGKGPREGGAGQWSTGRSRRPGG